MTNGEKILNAFPNATTRIYNNKGFTYIVVEQDDKWIADFDMEWWNAEYKEPTNTIDYRRAFKIACALLNGDILYGVDTNDIYELMMQKDGVVSSSSYEEYILNHLQELDQGQYASEPTTKNDVVALDFSDDIDTPNKYQTADGKWHEGTIPTTKNDLALIHTEGLDEEIRCTMCTNYMKSDRGCDGSCVVDKDMYKAVMDAIEKRIQPTTKNDLAVDCISREQALNKFCIFNSYDSIGVDDVRSYLKALPSVTPQEPRKDEVILTKEEYGELVSSEFDNGYAKGYREALEQEPIIDKIKAEIEQLPITDTAIRLVGDILDKYKAESESKE